jgi:hypothetical protein
LPGVIDILGGIGMSTVIVKKHGYEAKGMDALETINTYDILNKTSNDDVEDTEIVENLDFTQEEVVLGGSYSPEEPIKVSNKTTLKMEENSSITGPVFGSATDVEGNIIETDSYGIHVVKGGDLTIDGNGVIEAQKATYSMAVWAQGGKVTIKGGIFKNEGDGCDLIYASTGGKVEIYGGEFHPTKRIGLEDGTKNDYTALNLKNNGADGCEIIVYGGTFYNFDPAHNKSENDVWIAAHPNGFVAEGYKSVKRDGENIWDVVEDVE